MSLKVNNPGDRRQVLAALANEHTQTQCNRFGIVSGIDEYYGTIYHCNCLPASWVISPETGEKLEGG